LHCWVFFSVLLDACLPLGLPSELVSALGYVAVSGSATNTILASVFFGGELSGYDYLPYLFIVSAIAYVFNGNKSIYSAQKILCDLNQLV